MLYDPDPNHYIFAARNEIKKAVQALNGDGAPKERLHRAMSAMRINPECLHDDLRAEYQAIREPCTSESPSHPNDSALAASIRAMTDEEAEEIAGRIYDLYELAKTKKWTG